MTDLLERASAWLEEKRTEYASRTVVYQRVLATVEVQATIGRTLFEVDDGFGVIEKIESRDFLILAEELAFDDERTLPVSGDRIRETDGGQVFVYEVMSPGKEPAFRYSDPYRKTLRVHTKHIDTETV